MANKYIDNKGNIVYVGLYYLNYAAIYRDVKKQNKNSVRVDVIELPIREIKEQAQADLDRYAEMKNWVVYGGKYTCEWLYGAFEKDYRAEIQCGDNAFLCYTDLGKYRKKLRDVCNGDHTECRAYCFRQLELMGFSPQSYWDTEYMQQLIRQFGTGGQINLSELNLFNMLEQFAE